MYDLAFILNTKKLWQTIKKNENSFTFLNTFGSRILIEVIFFKLFGTLAIEFHSKKL